MSQLTDILKIVLASNFVLYLKTHSAHWNVTGMFFYELHNLFEVQYKELYENVDVIAEKIRQLDCSVSLTPHDQLNLSLITPEQPVLSGKEYVRVLFNDHNRMIMLLNKAFSIAEECQDQAIMNYIADRLDSHAKMRWFLKSSLSKFA